MLTLILLIFFLVQFLVILTVLILAIFFARPEVPLAGFGTEERPEAGKSPNGREKSRPGGEGADWRRHEFHHCNPQMAA